MVRSRTPFRNKEYPLAAKSAADATSDSVLREFLDWLEDILLRMIAGIFGFLLVHLPRKFCRVVARLSPTLVQVLKVGLVLAFGGLNWITRHEWLVARLGGDPLSEPGWYLPSLGRC